MEQPLSGLAEGEPGRSHLVGTTSGSDHLSHTISPGSLVVIGFCHKIIRRISMVWYVLLRKHLRTIPSIILIPDATASEQNRPQQGHLRHIKICQLPRPAKPEPAAPCRYRRLPPLPLPSRGNHNTQPTPWFKPTGLIKDTPNLEQEDHEGETSTAGHCKELNSRVQTRTHDTFPQECLVLNQNFRGLKGGGKLENNTEMMIKKGIHGLCMQETWLLV